MKRSTRILAAVAGAALLATACGGDDDATVEPTGTATAAPTDGATVAPTQAADLAACQVTDTGGIDDRSFNATAYKGIEDAQAEFGIEGRVLESQSDADYEPNINQFIQQGCDLIVTVGFLLGDATQAAAEANPEQDFAIVDFGYDPPLDNVLGLTFETDQAAFLAGYLAAGMTQSGQVGTFGGLNIPTVTIFMDGFAAGVAKYNEDNGTSVGVLGWDAAAQEGLFTGDFENQDNGRNTTQTLIENGADIIMPVAGPVGLGAAAAVQESPAEDMIIWVDTDGFVSASQFSSLFLTSVLKNMDVAVTTAIEDKINGEFTGGFYSGTLENDGVGLAPFHDFEDAVPQELKDTLDELRQGIIDGSISVDPADYA
jgi:basic membrane protein A